MPHSFSSQMPPLPVFLFFHLVMAVALWKLAERTKEEPQWFAIVPLLNVVLLLKIARKPIWWLILFLVPFVNIVVLIITTMAICERFGLNKWWGLVAVLSPFNLVLYLYMAFGAMKMAGPPPATPVPPAAA